MVVNAPTTLSFTMDKSSVLPGETVTFTITSPLAEELALSCNGTELCCFYADDARTDRYTWVVATTFEPGSTWDIAFAYRVDADSEWSEPCEAQQLTVGDAILLEPIVVTTESGLYMGEDAVFTWNAVEHTAYYSVSLNHDSWSWNVPLDSSTATSVTIPGDRLAEVGEYTLSVRAHTTDEAGYFCCQGIYLGSQYSCSDGALTFQVTNERTCDGFRYVLDEDGHAQIVGYDGDLTGVHLEIPGSLDGTTVAGIASGAFPAELTRVTLALYGIDIAPDAFAAGDSIRIYGYLGSTVQTYAEEQGYVFIPLEGVLFTADKTEVETGKKVTFTVYTKTGADGKTGYVACDESNINDGDDRRPITWIEDGIGQFEFTFSASGTFEIYCVVSGGKSNNMITMNVTPGPFVIIADNPVVASPDWRIRWTEVEGAESYHMVFIHEEYGEMGFSDSLYPTSLTYICGEYCCPGIYSVKIQAVDENLDPFAETETIKLTVLPCEGVPYEYHISGGECYITAYFGADTDVVIPAQINGADVVSIDWAFRERNWVESVVMPETLKEIGAYAFFQAESLECVTIPDSVEAIGDSAFNQCSKLKDVEIPDGVTVIDPSAFSYCGLTSLYIPCSVTTIGDSAFNGNQIDKIIIPDSIQIIESGTFYNNGATEVSIPSSVQSIKDFAFGMNALTEVEIPSSVSEIGYRSFAYNYDLADVYIYNSNAVFGDDVFHSATPTLHGYTGSTTQAYAEQYGLNFVPLDGESEDPDPTVKPDETEEPEITPTPGPQEAIAFTLAPDTITVGESVTFVITAPGAEQLKFIADAGTDSAFEETIPADGDVTTYTRTFTKAGARSIQFSALVDGAWTDPAPAQTVTVNSLGQLGKPTVTVQEPVYLGEGFTASWTAVEHAQQYVLHLTLEGVETWTTTTAETSAAIPGSAVTEEDTYILLVQPIADGYSQNEGSAAFKVTERPALNGTVTIETLYAVGGTLSSGEIVVKGYVSGDARYVCAELLGGESGNELQAVSKLADSPVTSPDGAYQLTITHTQEDTGYPSYVRVIGYATYEDADEYFLNRLCTA